MRHGYTPQRIGPRVGRAIPDSSKPAAPLCFACFEGRHTEHVEICQLFGGGCTCPKCALREPSMEEK
jgi:hypothetical protein